MSRHFIARATSLGMLAATLAAALLFAPAAAQAQGASAGCDRACLRQALNTYLAAVFKHDPSAVSLTADHYATENTAVVHNGEGFWKDISGYGKVQGRYFDPVNETAAYVGLLEQNGQDVIASVRIRVEDGKVSEAEWIIGAQAPIIGAHGPIIGVQNAAGRSEAVPQGMVRFPPPKGLLPSAERSSRFIMISAANGYFQAVVGHDGSWVPVDPNCTRVENGRGTTANTQPPGTPPVRGVGGCLENFANFQHLTKDLALRRFPLVDEEAGIILGSAVYVRYPGIPNLDNLVQEYFLIRDGKIAGIWSVMHFLPKGSPVTSGWENRQGGISR